MASRTFHNAQAVQMGTVVLSGSFAPNGSSAVAATSRKGTGFSVARTAAGKFTITLEDKYAELVCAIASLQLSTAADQTVQFGDCDVVTAKTVKLVVWDASDAAAADIAANANNRIHFRLVLRNTSAGPSRGV
jgi:hypothetical protein